MSNMSLIALTLQIVCLIGTVFAEDQVVPQLTEKRKLIASYSISAVFVDTYIKICNYKRKYYAI